ncbi:Arylamine N-acetyltransferase [Evansella caseinilytica]|uniref:Arylamine N-acetyltransferase n=1 Tax=Evansella caseinilytica TaxID=1503961 RepID=A0A1H3HFY8_9BACI|nr:arylamine N-acetyltransferase [Evansella caseinilytica]SDY14483.1 Arylamine N-acetyltransferase [Evansella caseinilytica]
MSQQQKHGYVTDYLKILGLTVEKPSYSYLEKICRAHLTTFPFENISKLVYYRDQQANQFLIPPLETFLANYQLHHFGGTCYTLNLHLCQLLDQLGFESQLAMLGTEHMAILVTLPEWPEEKVYVDCGAAAPIFQPVRFQTDPDNVSSFSEDHVYLKTVAAASGKYQYERYTNGKKSGKTWSFSIYQQRRFSDFSQAIDRANQPGTTFMTILRCQLYQLDQERSVSLVNNKYGIRYASGDSKTEKLTSAKEIEEVIHDEFRLERLPISTAIQILESLGIDIFAEAKS